MGTIVFWRRMLLVDRVFYNLLKAWSNSFSKSRNPYCTMPIPRISNRCFSSFPQHETCQFVWSNNYKIDFWRQVLQLSPCLLHVKVLCCHIKPNRILKKIIQLVICKSWNFLSCCHAANLGLLYIDGNRVWKVSALKERHACENLANSWFSLGVTNSGRPIELSS